MELPCSAFPIPHLHPPQAASIKVDVLSNACVPRAASWDDLEGPSQLQSSLMGWLRPPLQLCCSSVPLLPNCTFLAPLQVLFLRAPPNKPPTCAFSPQSLLPGQSNLLQSVPSRNVQSNRGVGPINRQRDCVVSNMTEESLSYWMYSPGGRERWGRKVPVGTHF